MTCFPPVFHVVLFSSSSFFFSSAIFPNREDCHGAPSSPGSSRPIIATVEADAKVYQNGNGLNGTNGSAVRKEKYAASSSASSSASGSRGTGSTRELNTTFHTHGDHVLPEGDEVMGKGRRDSKISNRSGSVSAVSARGSGGRGSRLSSARSSNRVSPEV